MDEKIAAIGLLILTVMVVVGFLVHAHGDPPSEDDIRWPHW